MKLNELVLKFVSISFSILVMLLVVIGLGAIYIILYRSTAVKRE